MGAEDLQKLDEAFEDARQTENVAAEEAMRLIGATIRKTALADVVGEELRSRLGRAYLLAKCVERWTGKEDAEEVTVPTELLSLVREDADGDDSLTMPVSEAMKAIGERIKKAADAEREATAKAEAEVSWSDVATGDEGFDPDAVDWGKDPDFSSV